jgi:hypothetical protein
VRLHGRPGIKKAVFDWIVEGGFVVFRDFFLTP